MRTDEQNDLIATEVVERARTKNYTEVRPIRSMDELIGYYLYIKSTKVVIKVLNKSSNKLFKTYCEEILTGAADVDVLLAYTQLMEIKDFYIEDLARLQQVVNEYKTYLCQGNFIRALLGEERDLGD
jgi:hypothetical protein